MLTADSKGTMYTPICIWHNTSDENIIPEKNAVTDHAASTIEILSTSKLSDNGEILPDMIGNSIESFQIFDLKVGNVIEDKFIVVTTGRNAKVGQFYIDTQRTSKLAYILNLTLQNMHSSERLEMDRLLPRSDENKTNDLYNKINEITLKHFPYRVLKYKVSRASDTGENKALVTINKNSEIIRVLATKKYAKQIDGEVVNKAIIQRFGKPTVQHSSSINYIKLPYTSKILKRRGHKDAILNASIPALLTQNSFSYPLESLAFRNSSGLTSTLHATSIKLSGDINEYNSALNNASQEFKDYLESVISEIKAEQDKFDL